MRNVLKSTSEAVHYWANQVQSNGKSGNVFFDDNLIFSYGRHFCMARILPSGAVAFTTRRYSVTTSGHLGQARNAISNREIVYCNDPMDSAARNLSFAREAIAQCLEKSKAPRIRQTTRDKMKGEALRLADNANAYLAALPENERENCMPIDTENLEGIRAQIEEVREAASRQRAARQQEELEEQVKYLQEWRDGGALRYGSRLYNLPTALRIAGDTVETSHGAEIPVTDALKLWPMIQRVMRGDRDYEPGEAVGVYRLTKIRRDGSIVVGCHDIAYTEIQALSVLLGLTDSALVAA